MKKLFKFFLVVIPRFFASFFEKKINEISDIFDSDFLGFEKPYVEAKNFDKDEEVSPEVTK